MSEKIQWKNDLFERKFYADFLTQTLLNSGRPTFVLNIDSSWGSGKSFFLQHWYEDIKQNHPAIFFDAWKTDYSKNPFISISSCFLEELTQYLPNREREAIKDKMYKGIVGIVSHTLPVVIKSIAKKAMGDEGFEALKNIGTETEEGLADSAEAIAKSAINGHFETQSNIVIFKNVIEETLHKIKEDGKLNAPLFVFVDELDRCRPNYAIELLETIKHLFDIEGVIFILATDTAQLASSVKSIYGESFSAEVYLKRFFDQSYTLPPPSTQQFTKNLLLSHDYNDDKQAFWFQFHHQNHGVEEVQKLISMIADTFSLELRDQNQCFLRLHTLVSTFPKTEKVHVFFLYYLIVLHHTYGHQEFKKKIGDMPDKQSSITFEYGTVTLTTQVIARLYQSIYNSDQKRVSGLCRSNDIHIARIAGYIYNQNGKQAGWANILQKYPDLVVLAGSIH